MKIRGTPAHIAEKYVTLARDAQTSGDPVLAENYLQHAEHYSRIIMAYRDQLNQPGDGMNGNGQRMPGDGGDDFGDEEGGDDLHDDGFPQPQAQPQQGYREQGQRRHDGNRDGNRQDRPFRRDQGRFRDRERYNDRDRPQGEARAPQAEGRAPQNEGRPPQGDARPPQTERPDQAAEGGGDAKRRDRFQPPHEQPEFLRRPVRRARGESDPAPVPGKDEPPRE